MDSSFLTSPSAGKSSESDKFIDDIFGPTSTGGPTLSISRPWFSHGPSRATTSPAASCPSQLSADPERSQIVSDFLERLSTLAVQDLQVGLKLAGLNLPGFSIQEFQRAAVASFQSLLPNAPLLLLLETIFQTYTSAPTSMPAAFRAIGQALHDASISSSSPRHSHFDVRHSSTPLRALNNLLFVLLLHQSQLLRHLLLPPRWIVT